MLKVADLYAAELERLEADGKIELHGGMKIHRYEMVDKWCVKIWYGKAKKPTVNVWFRTVDRRETFIAERIKSAAQDVIDKERRKVEQKAAKVAFAKQIEIGTLLHYSWGYDQTQCEYFQVVDKKGQTVAIREIQAKAVEGSGQGMACRMKPVRDAFVSEVITKRIGSYGLSMDHGTATPCTEDESHYCSWYA